MLVSGKIIIFILFLTLAFNGCSENDTSNKNSKNLNSSSNPGAKTEIVPQDNPEELGKIIKLPILPEEVTYIESDTNDAKNASGGSLLNNKKLVAVLIYSSENANQIARQAEFHAPPVPADIDAEIWFPPELIAKSQETGDEFLKGSAYAVNEFIQSPYKSGRLTRINDTDYFVLELTTF